MVSAAASPTTSPHATGHTVTAAQTAAGKLYVAAAATINATEKSFSAAWTADEQRPCACADGQHDQTAAMALVPHIETALQGMKDTLLTIRRQVTSVAGQVDLALTDADLVLQDFKGAYKAFVDQDLTAMGKSLDAAAADQAGSEKDLLRLRFDLGLPPPPGVLPVT